MEKFINLISEMPVVKLPNENFIKWLRQRINSTFIFFDTETTGLKRVVKKDGSINQLTQISAIATKLNRFLKFKEISRFNVNIKLNDEVKKIMQNEPDAPDDSNPEEYKKWLMNTRKGILRYNHYDLVNSESYEEERKALEQFDEYLKQHDNVILLAHNAPFDLEWIQFHELFRENANEIIDTKEFFNNIFFPTLKDLAGKQAIYQYKYDKFHQTDSGKKSASMQHLVVGFHDKVNKLMEKAKNAHNATTDCEMTIMVFEKGLNIIKRFIK